MRIGNHLTCWCALLLSVAGYAAEMPKADIIDAPDNLFQASPHGTPGAPSFHLSVKPLLPPANTVEKKGTTPVIQMPLLPALSAHTEPCYSMRTYMVRRVRPDSDLTVPSGYSTCMPAGMAELKPALGR